MEIAIRQVRGGSGADVWAENLCRGLNQAGHRCNAEFFPKIYQFIPSSARLHKNPVVDIVQGNSWNAFAFRDNAPLVVTEHHVIHDPAYHPYRSLPQALYHRWIFRCEKSSFKAADAVISDCEYTRKKLKEIFGLDDAIRVYVGIDDKLFCPRYPDPMDPPIPSGKTTLFFAGNLSRRKGADLLPAIMKELGDKYLLLVASGQTGASVTGVRNIVNLGRMTVDQLVATYNHCDIFLTPSRLEGFGLSVAEAMACEKPVVATNGSSLPELVVDGKGGFLCRMDDVEDFAKKIRHLAADENLRMEMGRFNRRRVEEMFTIEKMTNGYLDVYRSLTT